MIKLLGLIILLIGIWFFRLGLKYKDSGYGAYLTNLSFIGVAILFFILGIGFITSKKSFCEIFELLCE